MLTSSDWLIFSVVSILLTYALVWMPYQIYREIKYRNNLVPIPIPIKEMLKK